jgi:ABC-type polysaccharide/polyol phosphate export permease
VSATTTTPTRSARWVDIAPSKRFRRLDVREVWEHRELIALLAARDIRVKYKQALFGAAWAVLRPLIAALTFVVVFRRLLDVQTGSIPYWVFAAVGLTAWYYFSGTVDKASTSLVADAPLITKVYFPRIVVPLAALLPNLIELGLSLLFVVVASLVTGIGISASILALPVFIAALVVVTFAGGLLVATLNVRFRDTQQLVTLVIQLLFFATPIAYPSSAVPAEWQWLYFANPLAGIIEMMRWSVAGGPLPGAVALLGVAGGVVLLAVALLVYLAAERRFADVI